MKKTQWMRAGAVRVLVCPPLAAIALVCLAPVLGAEGKSRNPAKNGAAVTQFDRAAKLRAALEDKPAN